ncbi:alpha-galactosidase [Mizugakiibacter sediminis]|uniref:Alpha-galactosidase n=1 Tax=Mizugakiibacter sediminis TaxID=1475481 RepID=A0A0K8QN41_9GAMM|nr:hypothetical protein [Mizugakiibacter sediminis]GAP66294.1 alpha-galactosidase [Mizugakiibacter sediminis]
MSIVIDPARDDRLGWREPRERRQEWNDKAGSVYDEHPHTRPLWPWERDPDDEPPPCVGERFRDTLSDIHHAAADAASTKE